MTPLPSLIREAPLRGATPPTMGYKYLTKFYTARLRPKVQPLQPWAIGDLGGYLTKFRMGRLHPEVQLLTPLCTSFCRKGTPFVYLPLTDGTPLT